MNFKKYVKNGKIKIILKIVDLKKSEKVLNKGETKNAI